MALATLFIAFIPRFCLAISTWAKPTNDFDYYYRTAVELARGNAEMIKESTYTVSYPFLQAFVVFQSILIKLFGESITNLRIIYSLVNSLTCVVIYAIGRRESRIVGLLAGMFYALYISNIVFTSVLTCQHISTLLYYVAFYIFTTRTNTKKRTIIKFCFTGIILGCAQLMRAISPPILLAIFFFVLFKTIFDSINSGDSRKSHDKFDLKKFKFNVINKGYPILILVVLLICYVVPQKAFEYYAYQKGYRDKMVISSDIRFKIMVGLNYDGSGYSNSEVRGMFSSADEAEKKELLKQFVSKQIENPNIFFEKIFMRKMGNQWAGIDASYRWLYGDHLIEMKQKMVDGEASNDIISRYANCYMMQHYYNYIDCSYQILTMLFAIIGFWKSRKVRYDSQLTLFTWIILGYVSIHILIESQQRYRYFGMPIFFLFAAIGVAYSVDYIKKKITIRA